MENEPLSREFLLARGSCCHNNCKNCPYKPTIYKIKPFKKNTELDKLDNEKKLRVEEILGRKMNDYEWIIYKQMTMPKKK